MLGELGGDFQGRLAFSDGDVNVLLDGWRKGGEKNILGQSELCASISIKEEITSAQCSFHWV